MKTIGGHTQFLFQEDLPALSLPLGRTWQRGASTRPGAFSVPAGWRRPVLLRGKQLRYGFGEIRLGTAWAIAGTGTTFTNCFDDSHRWSLFSVRNLTVFSVFCPRSTSISDVYQKTRSHTSRAQERDTGWGNSSTNYPHMTAR